MKSTNAVACLAFEVTLAGFIGSTDATDDRVLWVTAPSADELAAATEGLDCTVVPLDFAPQSDIDFELPRDRAALRTRIRQFMAGPDRPDRECDQGCTRRAVPAAECDCSRATASSTDLRAIEIQPFIVQTAGSGDDIELEGASIPEDELAELLAQPGVIYARNQDGALMELSTDMDFETPVVRQVEPPPRRRRSAHPRRVRYV